MKIKIFSGHSAQTIGFDSLEEEVNMWISEQKDVEIVDIKVCGPEMCHIHIVVLYRQKA